MKRTPGSPATWSACMCVKQMAPSWRNPHPSDFQGIWVPSPQSKSVKVEPLRSSIHESQRPGRGIIPHVPSIQISSIKVLCPSFENNVQKLLKHEKRFFSIFVHREMVL